MSRIRGVDTTPELALWRELSVGTRNERIGRIRPDIVIRGDHRKVAVFVDGCFWHGCPDHYVRPRSSAEFWSQKLAENVNRDERQSRQLRADGWAVVRIWEHHVREDVERAADLVRTSLSTGRSRVERWHVVSVSEVEGGLERREMRKLLNRNKWRIEEGPRTTSKTGPVRRNIVAEGN